jgi:hypothetical protein
MLLPYFDPPSNVPVLFFFFRVTLLFAPFTHSVYIVHVSQPSALCAAKLDTMSLPQLEVLESIHSESLRRIAHLKVRYIRLFLRWYILDRF